MYSYIFGFTFAFCGVFGNAQSGTNADSTLFDFWVGEWNLTWDNADGTKGKGYNKIEKTLDGKVIQENFRDTNGFKGTSISVYNSRNKTWHQAWADNQGGYFDLLGSTEGDRRIFQTQVKESNGRKIIQRMVFYDIETDSFKWDWESSQDSGQSWTLQWRISYSRVKK